MQVIACDIDSTMFTANTFHGKESQSVVKQLTNSVFNEISGPLHK